MSTEHTIGRYTIERRLALGGMAEVLLCSHLTPGGERRQVVIKRILEARRDDPRWVKLLVDEARLASRFTHPNLVHVHGLEQDTSGHFMVMEYIEGLDLVQLVNACAERGRLFPFELAALIVAEAARGLHYAHQLAADDGTPLNLVHRDVSLANIIVTRHGTIKVVDFGVAKHATQTHRTQVGELKGKLSYMSPEQVRGEAIDRRSDIFSLGVVLYELLTGISCFKKAVQAETMVAVANARYQPPGELRADIPTGLVNILSRMLAADPAQRYQTAQALVDKLDAYMDATVRPVPGEIVAFLRAVSPDATRPPPRAFSAATLLTEEHLLLPGLGAELAEPGPRTWLPSQPSAEMLAAVFGGEETSKNPAFDPEQVPARRSRFRSREAPGTRKAKGGRRRTDS